ncbi:VOC family protein [Microvirga sp. W0021]|uniref:VOC family protein n=1 Tax=Hohaiivirga grylli TaxID=3133970 RepID=A0ABV0BL74_9HYPH
MIFKYTILYVDDVEVSANFFTQALGIKTAFIHESGDYAELDTGTTKLSLSSRALLKSGGIDAHQPSVSQPTFEIAFETDDVAGALKMALAAGATLLKDLKNEEWGQTTAYISDRNGYLIELCSPIQLPNPG